MKKVALISPDSAEYAAALVLRHTLFFKKLGIPLKSTPDKDETRSLHAAVPDAQGGILAYGRLTPLGNSNWRISQMVVRPDCMRQGLGSMIAIFLMKQALRRGGKTMFLAARLEAEKFYSRLGFTAVGRTYPSARTGVVHVNMRRDLISAADS